MSDPVFSAPPKTGVYATDPTIQFPKAPTTLGQLQALLNPVYQVSRAIPGQVSPSLPAAVLGLQDYFHQYFIAALVALRNLLDIEKMPRAALMLLLKERNLPIPTWGSDAQLRECARD